MYYTPTKEEKERWDEATKHCQEYFGYAQPGWWQPRKARAWAARWRGFSAGYEVAKNKYLK